MKNIVFATAILVAIGTARVAPVYSQTVPVATADTFHVAEDGILSVAAPGVLLNDAAADSVVAVTVSAPVHGSLSLRADGSFEYTPDAGFIGIDRFSYQAHVLPKYRFTIDPDQSSFVFQATLHTQVGSATDSDESNIEGSISAYLTPGESDIEQIQIVQADLVMVDSIEVLFNLGLFGTLHALAEADSLRMTLLTAGETTVLDKGGFLQAENEIRLGGTVFLTPSGAISFVIPRGPAPIDAAGRGDIGGSLIEADGSYELHLPVQFEGSMPLDNNNLDVVLTGTIVASATVAVPVTSAETEVIVNVGGTTARSEPDDVPARFALEQNYPNPFNPSTTIRYEVAAAGAVSIEVFDVLGRTVEVLVDGWQPAGNYDLVFQADGLPGGVYFYRLKAGGRAQTRQMLLLK